MNIFEDLNNKLKPFVEKEHLDFKDITTEEAKEIQQLYTDAEYRLNGLKDEDDVISVCNHILGYEIMDSYNDDVYTISIGTDNKAPHTLQGIRVYLDKETFKLSDSVDVYFNDEEYPFENFTIIKSKNEDLNKEEYKGYKIYNTDKETIFVNKLNDGYNIWTLGNIVKNPKEVIDNIDKYTNEGGSTFVQTEDELKDELKEFGITENLNEGEVISFNDYKNSKETDKLSTIISDISQEVVHVIPMYCRTQNYKIDGIKVLDSTEDYDFKYLQTTFYALDKIQEGENIPLQYKVFLKYEKDGKDIIDDFFHTALIGQGKESVSMIEALDNHFVDPLDRTAIFDGDLIPSESDVQKKINELNKLLNKKVEDEGKELPAKNYKKNPSDVEVGDILVREWGWSMRLVDYYRVISRTKSTIKLERLNGKRITKDGWQGEEIPTDKVIKDQYVDGKSFRIIPPEKQYYQDVNQQAVCRINGNLVEFWDGKPKSFDTLD